MGAVAIVALTHGGHTARALSKHKPTVPVYAGTSLERTFRQCGLLWGVTPLFSPHEESEWKALGGLREALLARGLVKPDDVVVVVNSRKGVRAQTNTLRILPVRDMGAS